MSVNDIGNKIFSNGSQVEIEMLKRIDSIIAKANKNIALFKKLKLVQIITVFILILSIVLMIVSESLPQEITAEEEVYYKPYSQSCQTGDLVKMEISDAIGLYEVTKYNSYSYQSLHNSTTSHFYYYLVLNPYFVPGYIYMNEGALSKLETQLKSNEIVTVYGEIIDTPKASDFSNNYITIGDDGYAVETESLPENNETTPEPTTVSIEIQEAIDELSQYKILQIDTEPVFSQTVVVGKGSGSYLNDIAMFLLLFSIFSFVLIGYKMKSLAENIRYAKIELDKIGKSVSQSGFCRNCGTEIKSEEKFCCVCGAKVIK